MLTLSLDPAFPNQKNKYIDTMPQMQETHTPDLVDLEILAYLASSDEKVYFFELDAHLNFSKGQLGHAIHRLLQQKLIEQDLFHASKKSGLYWQTQYSYYRLTDAGDRIAFPALNKLNKQYGYPFYLAASYKNNR